MGNTNEGVCVIAQRAGAVKYVPPDKPEPMLPGTWWCTVDYVNEGQIAISDITDQWATWVRVSEETKPSDVAMYAAGCWYREAKASWFVRVRMRVENARGEAWAVHVTLMPELQVTSGIAIAQERGE